MIVHCGLYREGRRGQRDSMSLTAAAEARRPGDFLWLGLVEPTATELSEVSSLFGLHDVAIEDARTYHLRPKVEIFDDEVQLVILRTARYDDEREEIDFGEITIFQAPEFLITVRQGVASELHGARTRLERRPELLRAGSSAALWAIINEVVGGYGPVIAEVERDIEELESTVFSKRSPPRNGSTFCVARSPISIEPYTHYWRLWQRWSATCRIRCCLICVMSTTT